MKAVVTGATGFIGTALVEELLTQGYDIIAVVRDIKSISSKWLEDSRIEVVEYKVETLSAMKADVFFHFAWKGTAGDSRADVNIQLDNAKLACEAVTLAKAMGCKRFIHAGSLMSYEVLNGFASEDYLPAKSRVYSISKLTAEYMSKTIAVAEQIEYVNVIISNVYGVGERSTRFINATVKKMLANETIPLTAGTQVYDFIYVTDAVKAIILVAEKGQNLGNYYIGNSNQIQLREFVKRMYKVLDSQSELLFGAVPMEAIVLDYKELNTTRLESELGFVPEVSFEEGIKRLSDWIKSED